MSFDPMKFYREFPAGGNTDRGDWLERCLKAMCEEAVKHSEYVPDLVSDNYNDLAVLYVAGPNATWRAWAEARMVVILKKADAWHPELNPNGVNERPISPQSTTDKP